MDGWVDVIHDELANDPLAKEGDAGPDSTCVRFNIAGVFKPKRPDDVTEEACERGLAAGIAERR